MDLFSPGDVIRSLPDSVAICRVCGEVSEQPQPPSPEWFCTKHEFTAPAFEIFLGRLCCEFQDHFVNLISNPIQAAANHKEWWNNRFLACQGESLRGMVEMSDHFKRMMELGGDCMFCFCELLVEADIISRCRHDPFRQRTHILSRPERN